MGAVLVEVYLAPLGLHFRNSFVKEKLGPGGPYLCVLVLGRLRKEKGRRQRRDSERDRPGCGKQLMENGKQLSVCLALAAKLPPLPRASMRLR